MRPLSPITATPSTHETPTARVISGVTHTPEAAPTRVFARLQTQAAADQWRASTLSRAIGRARTRVAAEQRAVACDHAARVAQARSAQQSADAPHLELVERRAS